MEEDKAVRGNRVGGKEGERKRGEEREGMRVGE